MELTEEVKDYVQKKADMLEKYLGDFPAVHADFEVEKMTNHHNKGEIFRAEMNLQVPGELLRVEKTGTEIMEAIDKVRDQMELVIKKYKDRKKGM